jgi:hypothetical protein
MVNTDAEGSSVSLITIYQTIRRHVPEDSNCLCQYLLTYYSFVSINSPGCKSKLNLCARTWLSPCKKSPNTGPQARLPLPLSATPLPYKRCFVFLYSLSLSHNFYFFCCLPNVLPTLFHRRAQTTQLVFPLWGVHKPPPQCPLIAQFACPFGSHLLSSSSSHSVYSSR